jgi:ubiquinone biosynthesis protein UbiJ
MTPALVCAAAEVAFNRFVRLEPAALADCAALSGRSIALHIADLDWTLVLEPHAGGVRVAGEGAQPPDVTVSARSLALLRLALATARGTTLQTRGGPAGVQFEGDTELLRRFAALLARVGFDPEELAARVVGDGAAHRVVGSLRGLFGWGRFAAGRLSLDAAEYLTEEQEDLARAADIEEWMNGVDELRDGAERLEARLALLEQRQAGSST